MNDKRSDGIFLQKLINVSTYYIFRVLEFGFYPEKFKSLSKTLAYIMYWRMIVVLYLGYLNSGLNYNKYIVYFYLLKLFLWRALITLRISSVLTAEGQFHLFAFLAFSLKLSTKWYSLTYISIYNYFDKFNKLENAHFFIRL